MARIVVPVSDARGTYAYLLQYFESDLSEWVANTTHFHGAGAPFPRQRILDGLRAGAPVNVPSWALPGRAQRSAPRRVVAGVAVMPQRAVVTPDDRITYTDEDCARLFLEENGL